MGACARMALGCGVIHFSKLRVWQRSHRFMLWIYRISAAFPPTERYGLTAQIRKAASSVPTNLAEGAKRESPDEFARFINISEASLAEVQSLLGAFRDLDYLEPQLHDEGQAEAAGIARELHSLKTQVRRNARR